MDLDAPDARFELLLPLIPLVLLFGGFALPVPAAAATALFAIVTGVLLHRDLVLATLRAFGCVDSILKGPTQIAVRSPLHDRALGAAKPDALGTPDLLLLVSDELAIVDNVMGKLHLVVYADARQPGAWRAAGERLERLRARLAVPLPEHVVLAQPRAAGDAAPLSCSVTGAQFLAAVKRAKDYIFAGDCMQVQISQRTTREFRAPPIALYRALRGLNPSPYMFYFDFGDHHVIGASPEIMVRVAGDRITLRPIAGTRPRGATPEDDARIAAELLADPKERAEHVMLIDLGRNDVGRVCTPGSVEVDELMAVESYAHVHHIVSNVRGRLRAGVTPGEVIRAVFPGGTITGCPKVRCMQLIGDLEGTGRGGDNATVN